MKRRCVEIEIDGSLVRVRLIGSPPELSPACVRAIQDVVHALRDRVTVTPAPPSNGLSEHLLEAIRRGAPTEPGSVIWVDEAPGA